MVRRGANIGLNRPSYVCTMQQVEPMRPATTLTLALLLLLILTAGVISLLRL